MLESQREHMPHVCAKSETITVPSSDGHLYNSTNLAFDISLWTYYAHISP